MVGHWLKGVGRGGSVVQRQGHSSLSLLNPIGLLLTPRTQKLTLICSITTLVSSSQSFENKVSFASLSTLLFKDQSKEKKEGRGTDVPKIENLLW